MDFRLPVTGGEPCQQVDPEMYFEEQARTAAILAPILKALCADCPILDSCRDHAVLHEEYGFWGGMSARERKLERRRLGIVLDSVTVVNQRTYTERMKENRRRERYAMSLLPSRSDAQWKVAGSDSKDTSAA